MTRSKTALKGRLLTFRVSEADAARYAAAARALDKPVSLLMREGVERFLADAVKENPKLRKILAAA